MGFIDKILGNTSESKLKKLKPLVAKINALESKYHAMTDAELRAQTAIFKERLQNGETMDDIMCEAFAVVREASIRTVEMRHFDVQLLGGMVLHQGRIAEMKTGEGKTLVATLPAYLNALLGNGVHIVTVNDYLAKRDAQWMGKIHRFLGLSVGCIVHDLSPEERKQAYDCDITYGTNNELGFDYLRDNMVVYKERMVQRELAFAIVDEVDSILIDEARTPLIISGKGEESSQMYIEANRFVRSLKRGENIKDISKSDQIMGAQMEESGDYMCDIKRRAVQLTAEGIQKAERYFNVESLSDADNTELNHYIHQALRANAMFERDKDYVVQNGQVIIVDEFTGRLMIGRRFNEGLHQALEAKEGVKVENENKTLATITFQNYFRMYKKLAGMTGTAKTEESEFADIYDLDVVEIPTNKPLIRQDNRDVVYSTEAGKFRAVVDEIKELHKTGQPILVGTISVERSEYLSDMLKRQGVAHEVLNAKYHAKEAEIVAQAGKLGQVTIATNMAGRGTDILLGGNPDFLARRALLQDGMEEELIEEATGHAETDDAEILWARGKYQDYYKQFKMETEREHEQVVALGGLHIIGTERHESRRIDNQLRGRAGRQGDPGSTRFYVSLQDELMRRFGADRMEGIMSRLSPNDEIPIENIIITKQIEGAQRRVETGNFETRKNVLRYDDVMNKQREIIYGQRRKVLMGEDMHASFQDMTDTTIKNIVGAYCNEHSHASEWNLAAVSHEICELCACENTDLFGGKDLKKLSLSDAQSIAHDFVEGRMQLKEKELMAEGVDMREVERVVLLRSVDTYWMDHIDAMHQLKQGIGLRAYAQKDPINAYTQEGFDMFDAMVESIREGAVKRILKVTVKRAPMQREQIARPIETPSEDGNKPVKLRREDKIGRNDPCPCGSGKKYKNCCGKN
ncbi:MAG: preprotein translocase subunit SecA [Eubacteriales bacterium]|nr:preprotein translocase subunit SecA [Eubacteriales bacterium]